MLDRHLLFIDKPVQERPFLDMWRRSGERFDQRTAQAGLCPGLSVCDLQPVQAIGMFMETVEPPLIRHLHHQNKKHCKSNRHPYQIQDDRQPEPPQRAGKVV